MGCGKSTVGKNIARKSGRKFLDMDSYIEQKAGMTVSEVAAYLRAHDKYLILTHRRPDGDTLGCAAALCAMLRQMGKTAGILYNRETTEHLEQYV